MLVFWAQKLTFLATTKTGSTAIEAALEGQAAMIVSRPPAIKHTSLHRYQRFIAPYLAAAGGGEFATVAIVREPQDWLGSWYRYRQRADMSNPARSTAGISFDDFVAAYCRENPPEFAAVGSQARFLHGKGESRVDHLFRHDRMTDFIDFMQAQLGCNVSLPRLNVSPGGDTLLSRQTGKLLRRFADKDFQLYHSLSGA